MAQLLLRNVSQESVDELKRRARKRGVSAQVELREIVERALRPKADEEWWAEADRLRAELEGRVTGDSTAVIRHYRDTR